MSDEEDGECGYDCDCGDSCIEEDCDRCGWSESSNRYSKECPDCGCNLDEFRDKWKKIWDAFNVILHDTVCQECGCDLGCGTGSLTSSETEAFGISCDNCGIQVSFKFKPYEDEKTREAKFDLYGRVME